MLLLNWQDTHIADRGDDVMLPRCPAAVLALAVVLVPDLAALVRGSAELHFAAAAHDDAHLAARAEPVPLTDGRDGVEGLAPKQ